ncbi:MAG: C1 family peptidase [Kiritimatiellia bacterium]|nr:C1 family peptidase [Lentisphaerota bacterium]
MRERYKLGWVPDVPDTRDVAFAEKFRLPRELPHSADLRSACSGVKDQGALGSCTAQALAGALEFLQLRELGGPTARYRDLSPLFLYYNTRVMMDTVASDSGAMLRTAVKSLKKTGICRELLWPYIVKLFAVQPPPPCYTEARRHRVLAYQRLQTLPEMRACLAMGDPFVFGFAVYEHALTAATARTGRLRKPRRGERMVGGHAVMAVGYDDRRRLLLFRNSWGRNWGREGYGELPYAYLESRELTDDFWHVQTTSNNTYARGRTAGASKRKA